MLLAYLKDRGEITEVQLMKVSVQEMGGRTFGVTLDGAASKVKDLKAVVADQEGFARWSQQLFRFGAGGGSEGASAAPLDDSVMVCDEDQFALCVDGEGAMESCCLFYPPILMSFALLRWR